MSRSLNVTTVLGARPQFIKAAPVLHELARRGHRSVLIHTGQHYDHGMSAVFFDELDIPAPQHNLEVGSRSHGAMTAHIMTKLEPLLLESKPDVVLVFGDTNSTLAAALVACKLRLTVAHVEAGLRSYNREMPEEHNRVVADHVSDLLFCPTPTAVANLAKEGIERGVHLVGDTMVDALHYGRDQAGRGPRTLERLDVAARSYILTTLHRPYLTDVPQALGDVLSALGKVGKTVLFPCHPRTRLRLEESGLELPANVRLLEPVGYLDMVQLTASAALVVTDSGGLQKEAFVLGVPCVTVRPETEWVETVALGWNRVVGHDPQAIVDAACRDGWPKEAPPRVYGEGHAAVEIVARLASSMPALAEPSAKALADMK
ncbi:MAG: UDP-N-acetylglucosamine 2-epimerase (non-hydrolyzing) [Deltaproteobacteria bacterium]|nr:UDP-N-acetylglucosamine 2-epimerase (non-hydrolyzing) [Deltaproteobacteria bacterium]